MSEPKLPIMRADLKDLVTKRSSIKGQITKFKNYLDKFVRQTKLTTIEIAELSLKISKFDSLSCKFDELQTQIELINSDNLDLEINERECIEQDFIVYTAKAKVILEEQNELKIIEQDKKRRESLFQEAQCSLDHNNEFLVKLPKIEIAKFDGSFFRWLEFRDTFTNLIHKNERLSSIQKYHYLLSYLEGDAARVISNLEVSSSNYNNAWQLLYDRFNNKRLLINHHLKSLFNIQQSTRETDASLRFLVDHVTKNLRALASLGQPTDHWDTLVIFMISSKLDTQTIMKWEEQRNSLNDIPSLEEFKKFLIDRAFVLESTRRNKSEYNPRLPQKTHNIVDQKSSLKSFTSTSSTNQHQNIGTFRCIICNQNHRIYDCPIFKSKPIKDKLSEVAKYKLCANCLRQGHPISECRMGPCKQCKKRHNTLLHSVDTAKVNNAQNNEQETVVNFCNKKNNQALLSTALIYVLNPITKKGNKVRALLDSGSQSSFITKSLQQKLTLNVNPTLFNVIGIGDNSAMKVNESCILQLQSLNSNYNTNLNVFVLDKLTGHLPKEPIDLHQLNIPTHVKLADPKFAEPAPIDILIGADLFWEILRSEQLSLGKYMPILQNSTLGWLIGGPVCGKIHEIHCNKLTVHDDIQLDKLLTKFWELEELPSQRVLSDTERACEEHFQTHTIRLESGRFCVKLPLLDSPDCLGDSYSLAKKRLLNLEKRFRKNSSLKLEYVEFIREYENLGHLSESPVQIPNPSYFLCHHPVFKMLSESTKIRVVFDGSAPSSSSFSINDLQMVGPNVQDSLFSILIRARQYKYLLCGDIAKMYRQVEVHPNDRNLQLILWREDESLPIKTMQLNTVTYGTASGSYLSTRCLWQLGEECADDRIKTIIQRDFYVDDLITGSDDANDLHYIQNSVSTQLNKGCFKLRKYKSNLTSIIEQTYNDSIQDNLTISESSSTLGLGWNPNNDTLHFPTNNPPHNNKITKRVIMSDAFKVFDPLGLVSPFIMKPKLLLQKLWQLKIDWDQPVPEDIKICWDEFLKGLSTLPDFQIPRFVLGDSPKSIQIHFFSDASQVGYGACVYIRTTTLHGDIIVNLLCSKSKVAPLKPTTIPRLELCAALLSSRLCKVVLESIRYIPDRIVCWCDSSTVLSWLNSDTSKLKTFVANRVGEIKEIAQPSSWRYVPTAENPADLISRGVTASQLLDSNLWWHGPSFLLKPDNEWPVLQHNCPKDLPEFKTTATVTVLESFIDFNRFSNLIRLQRTVAYVKRFIYNTKNRSNKRLTSFSTDELNDSLKLLYFLSQQQSFPMEYKTLYNKRPLNSKSKILSLSPFVDEDNLIRVGGRISSSNYSYDQKHPVLLDSAHHLCKLIFKYEHIKNMHAGPQMLLATVRQSIWAINGRLLARNVARSCVRCRRVQGNILIPKMGDLPSQRITPNFPFSSVGVDMAGPFYVINRKGRGAKLTKCYLCIFICLRYKCLHLEAVSDLSKDAFIMTLRRFVSRRGRPAEIFSDNGRNFVGAAKEINAFIKQNKNSLTEFAVQEGIKFVFSPAYGAHFGGIWEAGVKSAKFHIKRVMGNSHLTFEEISTLFAQVESILNSRPLCPLSSSPDDFLYLSPGHFLIGRPLNALPAAPLELHSENRLQRYARLEQIRQHFWRRWQKEYVSELQTRTKWKLDKTKISIGDLVLLCDDSLPPLCWRAGRIEKLYPGPDGISRVADVKTTTGCYRRPLVRLCPLFTEEDLKS